MLVGISIEERNTRSLHGHCKRAPNHRSLTIRLDSWDDGAILPLVHSNLNSSALE